MKTVKNGVIVNAGLDFVVTLPRLLQSNLFSVFFFKDAAGKLEEEDDIYGGSTDEESPQPEKSGKNETAPSPLSPKETSSSDHDTEDELRR